jgi:hypothetical protein
MKNIQNIMTLWLKARIAEPEEAAVSNQRQVNTRLHQQTREPSLGNSPIDTSHNGRGTAGSAVFCAVRPEAI